MNDSGKLRVRLAVASILAAAGPYAVHAADTAAADETTTPPPSSDEPLQEVVVTSSYVQSLQTALKYKKDSDIEKDVIVAEDMAKFPELNLAESIQRLPGVAITRDGGEGREISLQGLGPDFSRVQLNGMEVIADNDSAMDSVGQATRDRAFDFNLFASELFSRVEVEKTYQAAQTEGGMAGTVGLFTNKPFDNKEGWTGAINAKGGTNTYTDDFQRRLTGMLGYNWENTLGAEFSVAYSKRKTEAQGYNNYRQDTISLSDLQGLVSSGQLNISPAAMATLVNSGAQAFDFSEGDRLSVWDANQRRLGVTMALQYRPASNLLFTIDGLHGEYTTERDEYHLATRPFNGSDEFDYGTIGGGNSSWGPNVINTTSTIQAISLNSTTLGSAAVPFVNSVTVANETFGSEHTDALNNELFNSIELTGQWEATDALTVDGHVGTQTATYHTPYKNKFYMRAQGGFTTDYSADGMSASNTYAWNTTDAANYFMDDFYFRGFWNDNTEREAVLNLKYKLDDHYDVRGGVSSHRFWNGGTNWYDDAHSNGTNDPLNVPGGADNALYPYTNWTRSAPVGAFAQPFCEYKSGPCWLVGNFSQGYQYFGIIPQSPNYYAQQAIDVEQNFDVQEDTNDAWVQFDWDNRLFGKRFRGNVGARFFHTSTRSTGWIQGANYAYEGSVTLGNSYSGVLPALNTVLEFTPDVLLRFSATQNVNRPTLSSLAALSSVSVGDDGNLQINSGNPGLKPFKDTTLDLNLEWYFGKVGLVSVGVFHKQIKDWIASYDLHDVPLGETGFQVTPQLQALYPGLTSSSLVDYTYSVNDPNKANVTGAEFAAQSQFAFLPAPFDNLGVQGNFTYIHGDPIITGLSKTNANVTLFYESKLWGVRASLAHRSEYNISPFDSNPEDGEGFRGTDYVDAAAFVNLAHNFQITLDAINITNEANTEFYSIYHRLYNQTRSGATYLLGASWKF